MGDGSRHRYRPRSHRPEHGSRASRHAARRRGGRRRVRVHAQGAPDLARRRALPDARAARQHRRDRSRARSATPTCSPGASSGASSCACAGACSASATSCRSSCARSSAREGADADPTRFLPTAYRDLDELEGFLEHLAREVYDPALQALLRALLGDERAARADPARAVLAARARASAGRSALAPARRARRARRPATTPTSAACSSTPSPWPRWRSSCARCTRAWTATCC